MTEPLHDLGFEWDVPPERISTPVFQYRKETFSYLPYTLAALFGVLLGASILLIAQKTIVHKPFPAIVTLDMKKVIRSEAGRLSTKNMSEDEVKSSLEYLPKRLDHALKNLFGEKKPLILKPGAVVSSLPDVTPQVLEALVSENLLPREKTH